MYYGIPDEPTRMVSDAYSDKEYNDYLKRLYKVYRSLKITDKSTDAEKVYKLLNESGITFHTTGIIITVKQIEIPVPVVTVH